MAKLEIRTNCLLGYSQSIDVYHPNEMKSKINVFLLLHGMGGDHSSWNRFNLEGYVEKYNCVFVCPSASNSFYMNMETGDDFYDYISTQVLNIVEDIIVMNSPKFFICGLSMGGYGAFKIGLSKNKFSGIGNLSGAIDLKTLYTQDGPEVNYLKEFVKSNLEQQDLIENLTNKPSIRVYSYIGSNDFLYPLYNEFNMLIKNSFKSNKIVIDDGNHDCLFWISRFEEMIIYLLGER